MFVGAKYLKTSPFEIFSVFVKNFFENATHAERQRGPAKYYEKLEMLHFFLQNLQKTITL